MPCYQSNSLPSGVTTTGRTSYATEADCLNACKEGACCEGTTCSVKPACQCQGAGKVFKGVGTTCTPNPCFCPGVCNGGVELPKYLQLEISNFSGSLGDYEQGPNGIYSVPTRHISCKIFPAGQSCPGASQDCGVYQIFLDRHSKPAASTACCGGLSGNGISFSPDGAVDMGISIARTQFNPSPTPGGLSVFYCDLVPCCSNVISFRAGAAWSYTSQEWLNLLCSRTMDLAGVATGKYGYFQNNIFAVTYFGSVSFNYRITVNNLP